MNPDKFDFIGSDGGHLDSDADETLNQDEQAWEKASPYYEFNQAVATFNEAVWTEFGWIFERAAEKFSQFVEAKRREMMKRKGRG